MGLYDVDDHINVDSWTDTESLKEGAAIFAEPGYGQSIPDVFDLRTVGGVSPVKDKGKSPEGIGICWLFTANASLESHLLYKMSADPADALNIMSELYAAHIIFDISNGAAPYINPHGRKPGIKPSGLPAYGGHRYMSINYLTGASGTTAHCVDPYHKSDMTGQVLPMREWNITEAKPRKYFVKEVRFLSPPMNPGDRAFVNQVQDYIYNYGGVSCSIFWDDTYLNDLGGGNYSYFNNTRGRGSNHGITLVGWDDNYPTTNFNAANPPLNDGAFLAKNCWGTGTPGGAYFWISYESSKYGTAAYCVTNVADDFFTHPYRVYRHDTNGYNDLYAPFTNISPIVSAKNVFTAVSGDMLAGVGFYACTTCFVKLTLKQGGTDVVLVSRYVCPMPGYYTYDIAAPVALNAASFELEIEYRTGSLTQPAYVPLEIKDDPSIYPHWNIQSGLSFVNDGTSWIDVTSLSGPSAGIEYGHLCMRAIIENTSSATNNLKTVYSGLSTPAINAGFTNTVEESSSGFPLQWRAEPHRLSDYSVTITPTVLPYIVDAPSSGKTAYGFVNVSGGQTDAYICAVIGAADNCMRKLFKVNLDTQSTTYAFNAAAVPQNGHTSNLSGIFPVPGAIVKIEANGCTGSTTVTQSGSWELNDFELYPLIGGWLQAYETTKINITIESKDGRLLSSGAQDINVPDPVQKNGDKWSAGTVAALITAFIGATAVATSITIYITKKCCLTGVASTAGRAIAAGGSHVTISGQGNTLEMSDTQLLLDEAGNANDLNVNVHEHADFNAGRGTQNVNTNAMGCIVRKISNGGTVRNCHVSGSVRGINQVGGLFYESENVTVDNCSVDLKVTNADIYAGVAVKLSGTNNKISNVNIKGEAQANKVAGAVASISGGTVSKVTADIKVTGVTQAAGLIGESTDTSISASSVNGIITAGGAGGIAAGVAALLKNGAVKDCRVSANISAASNAAGIAATMQGSAKVSNCYSACLLTGSATDATVSGIAGGVSGISSSVSNCVSICSHMAGGKVSRVAWNGSQDCIAFNGITCDSGVSFHDGGETKKPAPDFLCKELFEQLGWDFGIWNFNETDSFPVLAHVSENQAYDYPFLNPYPPQNNEFRYPAGEIVAITGASHARLSKITWSLSPRYSGAVVQSGEFMSKLTSFYLQIAALPVAGDYDLKLIAIMDGHSYEMPVLLKIV